MTRLFRFQISFSEGLRCDRIVKTVTTWSLAIALSALLLSDPVEAEDVPETEDYRPFRPSERKQEADSPGFLTRWFGDPFQGRTAGISADYFLMESAELDNLIGTGSGTGYGLTFTASRGNSIFDVVGRVRFQYAAGEAKITEDAALRELPFALLGGEAILGLSVNLLPGTFLGMQPYFGTAYRLGLNHLALSDVPASGTDLSASSTGTFFGTELFVGVKVGRHFNFEFQLRQSKGSIGGLTDIAIGGAALALGYRW